MPILPSDLQEYVAVSPPGNLPGEENVQVDQKLQRARSELREESHAREGDQREREKVGRNRDRDPAHWRTMPQTSREGD